VAQFPLEMGRKNKTSNALAVQVDAEGKIKYDAIARQGQGKEKVSCDNVHRENCSYTGSCTHFLVDCSQKCARLSCALSDYGTHCKYSQY